MDDAITGSFIHHKETWASSIDDTSPPTLLWNTAKVQWHVQTLKDIYSKYKYEEFDTKIKCTEIQLYIAHVIFDASWALLGNKWIQRQCALTDILISLPKIILIIILILVWTICDQNTRIVILRYFFLRNLIWINIHIEASLLCMFTFLPLYMKILGNNL